MKEKSRERDKVGAFDVFFRFLCFSFKQTDEKTTDGMLLELFTHASRTNQNAVECVCH